MLEEFLGEIRRLKLEDEVAQVVAEESKSGPKNEFKSQSVS
jgi:hypothetical protein